MYHVLPDPFPGRCKNYRNHGHRDGSVEVLRCLDYEGVPHRCAFPTPRPEPTNDHSWGGNIQTNTEPEPWRRPIDRIFTTGEPDE